MRLCTLQKSDVVAYLARNEEEGKKDYLQNGKHPLTFFCGREGRQSAEGEEGNY
jgi:hypothetical protein